MAKALFVAVSLLLSFLGGRALEDLSPAACEYQIVQTRILILYFKSNARAAQEMRFCVKTSDPLCLKCKNPLLILEKFPVNLNHSFVNVYKS